MSPKIFVTTLFTPDPSKAVMQDTAVKEAVDHLLHIWPKEPVLPGEALLINLFQFFKVFLNTLIIGGILRFSRLVDRRRVGHRVFFLD